MYTRTSDPRYLGPPVRFRHPPPRARAALPGEAPEVLEASCVCEIAEGGVMPEIETITLILADGTRLRYTGPRQMPDDPEATRVVMIETSRAPLPEGCTFETIDCGQPEEESCQPK